jgi:plastocyanin
MNREKWKITAFFFMGITFLLAVLSRPLYASGLEGQSGSLKGKVKVFRARHSGDVVVYLEGAISKKEFSPPTEHAILDQKNLIFIPRVLPILKGTTVDFKNSDDVQHNVFAPGDAEKFNLGTWGIGEEREYTFNNPGEVVILCNVHSEMVAYILVLENPYFCLTDKEGNFTIENIPSGTYSVKTWHEKRKSEPLDVTISAGMTEEIHLDLKKRK